MKDIKMLAPRSTFPLRRDLSQLLEDHRYNLIILNMPKSKDSELELLVVT